jgi:hypothetical protein
VSARLVLSNRKKWRESPLYKLDKTRQNLSSLQVELLLYKHEPATQTFVSLTMPNQAKTQWNASNDTEPLRTADKTMHGTGVLSRVAHQLSSR